MTVTLLVRSSGIQTVMVSWFKSIHIDWAPKTDYCSQQRWTCKEKHDLLRLDSPESRQQLSTISEQERDRGRREGTHRAGTAELATTLPRATAGFQAHGQLWTAPEFNTDGWRKPYLLAPPGSCTPLVEIPRVGC